ncbi:non-functional NADPH-dependent codeinone reductase 2-like [Gossypium australe]|uniref:Non-functional NADPH-dependent codeinone reductase 2-like n=1 Tax=Gossypium australe TaxID=47621 RepID=A0A5B6WNL8_9ROSI|nr:non-functional NADPH-dependent codeinone reductase 2-like [Gossypium australe]
MDSSCVATSFRIPEQVLTSSGQRMQLLGFGTAAYPLVTPEVAKQAILQAIELGYRHFDTAYIYGTEQPLGEAIVEAISLGLIKSRDELFITTKLWCSDAYGELVLPQLRKSLQNLKMEYVDLYLIHWPLSSKQGRYEFPVRKEEISPMDFGSVWAAMEDCQRLGLTKSIGVSNFSCKKLADILALAKIPPAVNQVEFNPLWNQKKLREYCKANGVLLIGYSPLGASGTLWGSSRVLENEVLKEIAEAKGKTVAQICLKWAFEEGVGVIVKSFNVERMKQNLEILDWSLSEEERKRIGDLPQSRSCTGESFVSENGTFKTIEEFWDGENMGSIPDCVLRWSGQRMPVVGFGTASEIVKGSDFFTFTKQAVLQAIKLGYRHFDTASLYGSEQPLGEAIVEALSLGLIKSRNELFITSKL